MMHYKKLLAAALTVGCTATAVPVHNANAATLKIGYGGKTRYYTGAQLTFDYKNNKLSGKYAGIQQYKYGTLLLLSRKTGT